VGLRNACARAEAAGGKGLIVTINKKHELVIKAHFTRLGRSRRATRAALLGAGLLFGVHCVHNFKKGRFLGG